MHVPMDPSLQCDGTVITFPGFIPLGGARYQG